MTFEELKAEATRQGYNLVKMKPKERFLPCTCGCNQRTHWFSTVYDSITLECKRCEFKVSGKSEADAKRNWNIEIRKKLGDII